MHLCDKVQGQTSGLAKVYEGFYNLPTQVKPQLRNEGTRIACAATTSGNQKEGRQGLVSHRLSGHSSLHSLKNMFPKMFKYIKS